MTIKELRRQMVFDQCDDLVCLCKTHDGEYWCVEDDLSIYAYVKNGVVVDACQQITEIYL